VNTFLTELVADRLRMDSLRDLSPSGAATVSAEAELVGRLGLIAFEATMLYATAIKSSDKPLASERTLRLPADDYRRLKKDIVEMAQSLTARTAQFRDKSDFGGQLMSANLKVVAGEISTQEGITALQVGWLTDLVWHAIRFDAPYYPDSESMAVQIALCAAEHDSSNLRVHAAAASGPALVVGQDRCAKYYTEWLGRMIGRVDRAQASIVRRKDTCDPYATLVRALRVSLDKTNEKKGIPASPVFVIDASLDQRMCDALERSKVSSAVVFPISVGDIPGWGVRTSPENTRRLMLYEETPTSNKVSKLGARVVIVKPYGAPLEDLPVLSADSTDDQQQWLDGHTDKKKKKQTTSHRILSDDLSVLHDLVRKEDSLPPGLRKELHTSVRTPGWDLFFLGYPLDEQGRRMRIVADVEPQDDEFGIEPKRYYISQPTPTGLTRLYLDRAGFTVSDQGLTESMSDLADCLDDSESGR